jgi:BNR/Asp-box repeat
MRRVVSILLVSAVALGAGASVAAAAGPQQTVTGTLINRAANTLAPGTTVAASEVYGNRVFIDANRGYALVQNGQAQYPAATTDGGKTWKTNGPALHVNAAQAPLAVAFIGAGGTKKIFAWGGGQVIDATPDGGAHWYRATFTGLPVAVLKNPNGRLVAFVDGQTGSSSVATQYVSKNGGKTWKLDNTIGG